MSLENEEDLTKVTRPPLRPSASPEPTTMSDLRLAIERFDERAAEVIALLGRLASAAERLSPPAAPPARPFTWSGSPGTGWNDGTWGAAK